jgi:hypothetical protein
MEGLPRDRLFSSTRQVDPQASLNNEPGRWRANASPTPAGRSQFASLTAEEELTYRHWRRIVLAFYAVFLSGITAIAIATWPADQSSTAKKGDLYSALASAVQRNSHSSR